MWQGSQVLAEHNGSTGAVLVDYVYSGSRMIAKIAGGSTQYLLSDRLSVRLVLDSSGNVAGRQGHLAFGEDFGESGTQEKHHFTNYERDGESGTDYAINRSYSQDVGTFMRVDPVYGSLGNPQNLNRYSYVKNDARVTAESQSYGLPGPINGPRDALRHCIWSCEMARSIGVQRAKKWADARECNADGNIDMGKEDTRMDLWNNEVGRKLGAALATLDKKCVRLCEKALDQKKLYVMPRETWPN